jgi:hypothetical protein
VQILDRGRRLLATMQERRESRRGPRLQDSAARRRRLVIVGSVLVVTGLVSLVFGVVVGRVPQPAPVQLDATGTTSVPHTAFFQNGWVLFGQIDDPRRVPAPEEIGCAVDGGGLPVQPSDMTAFGARVLDGVPVSAMVLVGRTGQGATITCTDATDHQPLWLASSSEAPAFTPTGFSVLGAAVLVLGVLVHPLTLELPARLRARRRPRG